MKTVKQETAPVVKEKEQSWEDKLPPFTLHPTFDLYAFKTAVVNASEKAAAFQDLWNHWDPSAMSFYFVHYQKYEGEG